MDNVDLLNKFKCFLDQYPKKEKSIKFDFLRLMAKECLKRYSDVKDQKIVDVVYVSEVCRYILEALIEFLLFKRNEKYFIWYAIVAQKDLIDLQKTEYNQMLHEINVIECEMNKPQVAFNTRIKKLENQLLHLFNGSLDWKRFPIKTNREKNMYIEFILQYVQKTKKELEAAIEKRRRKIICRIIADKTFEDFNLNESSSLEELKGEIQKYYKDNLNLGKYTYLRKAVDVGLEREYEFIYDYSSKLVHCQPTSFMTRPVPREKEFVENCIDQYMAKIYELIRYLLPKYYDE